MSNQPSNLPAKRPTGENQEETLAALVKRYEGNIRAALPEHVKPERVLSVIKTAITTSPSLRDCSPLSVLAGIVTASRLGLELDPVLGQAYLVPRWNKNTKRMEASFQLGYQGMLELTHRADHGIIARVRHVREHDEFELLYEPEPKLTHRINTRRPRGKVVASYTYVKYPDGKVDIFEPMNIDEALAIRDRFAPRKRCRKCWGRRGEREKCEICKGTGESDEITGPWVTDQDEMVRKTCLRRDWKWLPKSVEIRDAMRIENRLDAGESPEGVILDLPVEAVESAEIAGATDAKTEALKKRLTEKQEQRQNPPQDTQLGGEANGTAPAAPAVSGSTDDGAEGERQAPGRRVFDSFPDPLAVPDGEIVVADVVYRANAERTGWVRVVQPPAAQAPAAPPAARPSQGRRSQMRGNPAASDAFDFAGGKP